MRYSKVRIIPRLVAAIAGLAQPRQSVTGVTRAARAGRPIPVRATARDAMPALAKNTMRARCAFRASPAQEPSQCLERPPFLTCHKNQCCGATEFIPATDHESLKRILGDSSRWVRPVLLRLQLLPDFGAMSPRGKGRRCSSIIKKQLPQSSRHRIAKMAPPSRRRRLFGASGNEEFPKRQTLDMALATNPGLPTFACDSERNPCGGDITI